MEIVIDYIWSNKYILIALGILTIVNLMQWWNVRKIKRGLKDMQTWSRDLYEYLGR